MAAAVPAAVSPDMAELLNKLNYRFEINLTRALANAYGYGYATAAKEAEKYDAPQLHGPDVNKMVGVAKKMIAPIYDYNEQLAAKIDEMISQGLAEGKDDSLIARELRETIPRLLKEEPITIQRPGKQPVAFTADSYADLISRTVPFKLCNEGYIDGIERGGLADGWISVATKDERMCPVCGDKHGKVYGFNVDRPPYHPLCRCRPLAHYAKSLHELAEMARARKKKTKEEETYTSPKKVAEEIKSQVEILKTDQSAMNQSPARRLVKVVNVMFALGLSRDDSQALVERVCRTDSFEALQDNDRRSILAAERIAAKGVSLADLINTRLKHEASA